MWNLEAANRSDKGKWKRIDTFLSLQEAVREIIRLENLPVEGLFLQTHIETNYGDDEEFLSLFTFDGKESIYTLKKSVQ